MTSWYTASVVTERPLGTDAGGISSGHLSGSMREAPYFTQCRMKSRSKSSANQCSHAARCFSNGGDWSCEVVLSRRFLQQWRHRALRTGYVGIYGCGHYGA